MSMKNLVVKDITTSQVKDMLPGYKRFKFIILEHPR